MSKQITAAGLGPVQVPTGSDTPDVPRDMEKLAIDMLGVVAGQGGTGGGLALPGGGSPGQVLGLDASGTLVWLDQLAVGGGGGRTFLKTNVVEADHLTLNATGYVKLAESITVPEWAEGGLLRLKAWIALVPSDITGNESEGGPRVRVRFTRENSANHTGYQDFFLPNGPGSATDFEIAHSWQIEANAGWTYSAYISRSSNWSCYARAHQFGVQLIEKGGPGSSLFSDDGYFKSDPDDPTQPFPGGWQSADGVTHAYLPEPAPFMADTAQ